MTLASSLKSLGQEPDLPQDVLSVTRLLALAAQTLLNQLKTSRVGSYQELSSTNTSGDLQTTQDDHSHNLFANALSSSRHARFLVSEEAKDPVEIGSGGLSIAIDPFDGSRAYRYGIPAGTIFGLFRHASPQDSFKSARIVASGILLYGLTIEAFVAIEGKVFRITPLGCQRITSLTLGDRFLCANLSNLSRWHQPWQTFFDTKVLHPKPGKGFNSRWFGSLATHTKTVILSGGLFAYPPDTRQNYAEGHLRLVYEAIPVAYLIQSLGGKASDGRLAILDLHIDNIHARTPLVFGEPALVTELEQTIRASGTA